MGKAPGLEQGKKKEDGNQGLTTPLAQLPQPEPPKQIIRRSIYKHPGDNKARQSSQRGFAKPKCCHANLNSFPVTFLGHGDGEAAAGILSLGSAGLPAPAPTTFSSTGSGCRWCRHPGSGVPGHGVRLLPKTTSPFGVEERG